MGPNARGPGFGSRVGICPLRVWGLGKVFGSRFGFFCCCMAVGEML